MLYKILKIAPGHSRYCLRYKQIYFEILVDFSADQNCVNALCKKWTLTGYFLKKVKVSRKTNADQKYSL